MGISAYCALWLFQLLSVHTSSLSSRREVVLWEVLLIGLICPALPKISSALPHKKLWWTITLQLELNTSHPKCMALVGKRCLAKVKEKEGSFNWALRKQISHTNIFRTITHFILPHEASTYTERSSIWLLNSLYAINLPLMTFLLERRYWASQSVTSLECH